MSIEKLVFRCDKDVTVQAVSELLSSRGVKHAVIRPLSTSTVGWSRLQITCDFLIIEFSGCDGMYTQYGLSEVERILEYRKSMAVIAYRGVLQKGIYIGHCIKDGKRWRVIRTAENYFKLCGG